MSGFLALEDGTVFHGESVAGDGWAFGEAVFTTAMTGYQEVVTDPSFAEQLVCFTAPMVGNYGVASARSESKRPHARAVLMREARGPQWTDWLHERGIVALSGIDTRSLVLKLRDGGAMRAVAVAGEESVDEALRTVREQPTMEGRALVADVSTNEPYTYSDAGTARIAVVDYGVKRSILRRLATAGAAVTVFPHDVDADELAGYDGVVLSNGPRRPRAARGRGRDAARAARPHAGARHLPRPPAARARRGHEDVQAAVRPPRRESSGARPRDRAGPRHEPEPRLRGRAVRGAGGDARVALRRHGRGLDFPDLRARSAQFHPEAGPGPHDAWPILSDFIAEVKGEVA